MAASTDKLLEEVKQLSPPDLEHFVSEVVRIQAQRKAPSLTEAETDLFLKINNGMPPETQRRYWELISKRDEESLTPEEYEELLQLTGITEKHQAERLEALIKLSQLRNMSLDELMTELGITPPGVQ